MFVPEMSPNVLYQKVLQSNAKTPCPLAPRLIRPVWAWTTSFSLNNFSRMKVLVRPWRVFTGSYLDLTNGLVQTNCIDGILLLSSIFQAESAFLPHSADKNWSIVCI